MFYSQFLLSKKGPLGTIWIAAHFHKKLKKDQVNQTNIPSSVDKILHDEVPVVTYRILGFLLLGVVRIYSKKVEYLFHDCCGVLSKLGDPPSGKRAKYSIESLRVPSHSIALPERFELDTFNLGLLEDQNLSSDRSVRSREDIMLADAWKDEGIKLASFDKYHEEDPSYSEAHSTAYPLVRDVLSPHFLDVNSSQNKSNLDVGLENRHESRFFLEECLEPMTFDEAEEELDVDRPFRKDLQTNGKQLNTPVRDVLSPHFLDVSSSQNKSNSDVGLENHHESRFFLEECLEPMTFDEAEEELDPDRPFRKDLQTNEKQLNHGAGMNLEEELPPVSKSVDTGNHMEAEMMSIPEVTYSESRKLQSTKELPASIAIDVTPQSKLPGHHGEDAPEAMAVRTPAAEEHTRVLRKRKCLYDDKIVVPNKMFKHWISDSSNLVCKRRKAPHTAFLAWKAHKISNLRQSILEPLIPIHIGTLVDFTDAIGGKVHKSQEQSQTAPLTPLAHSTSVAPHGVEEVPKLDVLNLEPATPIESMEKGRSPSEDHELDFCLTDEEINSLCYGDSQETFKTSVRTRAVAGYLYRKFEHRKRRKEEEVINLSQISKGKTKKESARLFHELLVLKTGNYIGVRQDNAYDDILVLETPALRLAFEAEAVCSEA